ncbi:MAG: nucleotidyltransferase family protein, partial [Patescibacteria group bacterium]
EKNGVKSAGLFGSYSRGEAAPESDIDILVSFSETKSLLDIIGLELELSDIFNKKVDLVTENFLSRYFREDVLNNLVVFYERK